VRRDFFNSALFAFFFVTEVLPWMEQADKQLKHFRTLIASPAGTSSERPGPRQGRRPCDGELPCG
jgi:hypothetical protein